MIALILAAALQADPTWACPDDPCNKCDAHSHTLAYCGKVKTPHKLSPNEIRELLAKEGLIVGPDAVVCGGKFNGQPMPSLNCPSDRPKKGRGQ